VRLLNAGRDGFIDPALPIFEAAGIDPDMDVGVIAVPGSKSVTAFIAAAKGPGILGS
jgi:hypothetical protein